MKTKLANITTGMASACAAFCATLAAAAGKPEISWSIMHPTAIDTNYMARVAAKAAEYGGVDSFEVCGNCHRGYSGINGLSMLERYPHAHANVDAAAVERNRREMVAICDIAHAAGKPLYYWHREIFIPKGLLEDLPGLLDADGEFDLLGNDYRDWLRYKLDETFRHCPGLDGIVLTLTEADYSVIHNSNPSRYPPQKVVEGLVGLFAEEHERRGKRFILRSFGSNTQDYIDIIGGAKRAAAKHAFEIETKVTEADFVPWLSKNPFLKKNPPLTLGAECDAHGEYLSAGYLPAAQVGRIREYVESAREEGADRYTIRIDRVGNSIFDSAHEVNLYAYMRFVRDPAATEDMVLSEYAAKHFGAAATEMVPVMKGELEIVRGACYIASNLMFHTPPTAANFRIAKAGGVFALFREGEPLSNMSQIWSMFDWMRAPSHDETIAEKDRAVAMAEAGLATVERLAPLMPPDEASRQRAAFSNAVVLASAMRGFTRCAIAYFKDMSSRADEPKRLKAAVADAMAEIARLSENAPARLNLDGIAAYCTEFLEEYRVERSMRRHLETSPGVIDFVIPGGIFDDGRVSRMMHAAYSERKGDRLVRHVGNARYPNGKITVRLNAPQSAQIDVVLCPDGAQSADIVKKWANGTWTVSIGKKGQSFPSVMSIAAFVVFDAQQ